MWEEIKQFFLLNPWLDALLKIIAFFLLAYIVHRLARRIAKRIMSMSRFAPENHRLREERQQTLRDLIASAISFVVFSLAVLGSLNQFVGAEDLVWMVGLFSAAFGLGARPLISDFLTGVSFIFEDTFDVGEKVEIMEVTGVVESVNLRTTFLRAPTGELYVIPNGEVRLLRNFSRGRFSVADITLKLAGDDLARALELLEALSKDAMALLPNLLEPWQIISETGVIGQQTELKIIAKARYGRAAEMRPHLLTLVHERLAEAGIELVS